MNIIENAHGFASGLTVDEDEGILTIAFAARGEKNVSPMVLLDDFLTALDFVDSFPSAGAIVLRISDGGFDFDAGAMDVNRLSPEEAEVFSLKCTLIYQRLSGLHRPVIAAVAGDCFGIALEMVLHCDLRIANTSARFGLTGMNFGLAPNGAAVTRLIQLIGESHARMMSLTGAMISAERAFVMGFVTNVLDDKDFDAGVSVLSRHLAAMSPVAISETKKILVIANSSRSEGISDVSAQALSRCIEEGKERHTFSSVARADFNATIH